MVIFWLTGCLRGRNGQGHSLRIRYLVPFHCFAVGADPCVRPAETSPILIPVGRIRTISKHIPLLPTWNKFKLPTTGGHIVYRLV